MTVDTLPTMPHTTSKNRSRMIPKPAPFSMHTPIGQHMPSRYESSEEEVSGSDTTHRDDRSCSSTDADSDTGRSSSNSSQDEDNGPARRHHNPERAFSFLTSPNRDSFHSSRPPSVYTVRRISGLTLRTQQEDGTSVKTSRSNSPSTTRLSIQRADGTASSLMFEAESRAKRQSCYSDITPSDDDLGPPDSPLVATPVTYHAPGSRPNIVSITPPPKSPTHSSPPSLKKQMAEDKETPIIRKKSNASSNGVSMKTRLARLRMAKHQQRLISSIDPDSHCEYSPPVLLSPAPKPVSSIAGWASNMSAPVSPSTLGPQAAEQDQDQEQKQKLSRINAVKKAAAEHHTLEHPDGSRRSFIQPDSQKLLVQERSNRRSYIPYRKPATESQPLPTNTERRPSSPAIPQTSSTSRRSSIRSYYESQFLPNTNTGRIPAGNINKALPQPQQQQQQPAEHINTPTRTRSRTRSINSIASTSSKFSTPAFDSASLKGIAQRYQHRYHYQNQDLAPPSTSSSSTNSISGSTYTASLSPDPGRRPSDCSMLSQHSQLSQTTSNYLTSKSTTNLSTYTTAPPPSIRENDTRTKSTYMDTGNSRRWSRNPNTSPERLMVQQQQQQHARNKSFKWGESVSQASSKAMTGLGFMLKKRTS